MVRKTKTKGSMTLFLSLILSLLVALVGGCLLSVQTACARVQIGEAVDIGLYSLFAQYDKNLLDDYSLFYLDGGFGSQTLNMGKVYDVVEEYMMPVLKQNYQNLEVESGGITGYRLATDNGGESFRNQAVAYMKESLGEQGAELLIQKVKEAGSDAKEQRQEKEEAEAGKNYENYDEALNQASGEEGEENPQTPAQVVDNPIEVIRKIQKMGILELVLPDPENTSGREMDLSSLPSHRKLQKGMGVYQGEMKESTAEDIILFREYILRQVANYRNPDEKGLLAYPLEYILGKKGSDRENLKAVAQRLLLIREGVNFTFLLTNPAKRAQAASLGAAIATAMMIPVAQGIVEMLLISCWAYGESILDVRELFSGGKVPLVKTEANWQLSLENLSDLLARRDSDRKNDENGLGYEAYLRILLYLEGEDSQIMRCLDAFELTLRGQREDFSIDSCIDALEISFDIQANGRKTFYCLRQYSYT